MKEIYLDLLGLLVYTVAMTLIIKYSCWQMGVGIFLLLCGHYIEKHSENLRKYFE